MISHFVSFAFSGKGLLCASIGVTLGVLGKLFEGRIASR
jgi:hypothetical protein